jgi:hypothetical protein
MRSEVWRPAAAARNRAPGGPGHRPPGTIRPGCEELAARAAEEMLQTEARPPATNRHGGAPRGERTDRKVRVAPRKRDNQTMRLSALRHPSGWESFHHPGAIAPRERIRLFDIVRRKSSRERAFVPVSTDRATHSVPPSPSREGWSLAAPLRLCHHLSPRSSPMSWSSGDLPACPSGRRYGGVPHE